MTAIVNKGLKSSVERRNNPTIAPNVLTPENSPTNQPEENHSKNETMDLQPCSDGSCSEWEEYFEKYYKLTRNNYHFFLLFVLFGAILGFCLAQFLGHSDL